MTLNLSDKTVGELESLVKNHQDHGKTDSDIYIDALRELELRRTKGLDLKKTLELVSEAARARRFVRYQEVAAVNDLEWSRIHYQIGRHLLALCEYCHRKGLPLLSAIVVNAENVDTGEMKPESQSGFIEAARLIGLVVLDEKKFVSDEQEKVFSWASDGARA
jgi:hypothetical protein